MSCPTCGSTQGREIAPGYIECGGTVQVDHAAPVPGGRYLYDEPCRTRYHRFTSGPPAFGVCACGTYAVRQCRSCGEPLCGDCSVQVAVNDGKQWWCRGCVQAAKDREQQQRLAGVVAGYQRVRALPRGGVAELGAVFRGDSAVVDGQTHQFLELTNREFAEFAFSATGTSEAYLECLGPDVRLYRDGTRRLVSASQRSLVDGDSRYTPAVDKIVGQPDERFNEQPLISDPRIPALLYQRGHGDAYETVNHAVRQVGIAASSRGAQRRVEREYRSKQNARLATCLVLAGLAIGCAVGAVSVLQSATDTRSQNPAVLLFFAAVVLAGIAIATGSSWATRR